MKRWWWGVLVCVAVGGCGGGGGDGATKSPDAGADAAEQREAAVASDAGDGAPPAPDARPADAAPPATDGTPPVTDGTPPGADGAPPVADGTPPGADAAPDATSDPCAAMACDVPPPAVCDGDERVEYGPGQCVVTDGAAACQYPEAARAACGPGRACRDGQCVVTAPAPAPGELIITEVMYDPIDPLADDDAEWVELHSLAADLRGLDGCAFADADHVAPLDGIVVPAGGYVVLARSADPAVNGGLDPDGVFDFGLGNDAETIHVDCGGQVLDALAWDEAAGWPEARGATLQRDAGAGDGPDGWCVAGVPYFGVGGMVNSGTPGAENPACPRPDVTVDACRLLAPVDVRADAGTMIDLVGRVTEAGITDRSDGVDDDPALVAQVGFGAHGVAPGDAWTWLAADGTPGWDAAAAGAPGEDEYRARLRVPAAGDYDVAARFSRDGGMTWTTCDANGDDFDRPGRLQSVDGPCAAETCETPPPARCADDTTRVSWSGPGECSVADGAAECAYVEAREDCTGLGGECLEGECVGNWAVAGAGEVVFTEILYDAAGPLGDDGAEWFEIQSVADGPRTLHGCQIEDASNHLDPLDRVLLQPGQILLFAHTDDPMLNGGIAPDLLFDFGLGNHGETLTLRCGDVVVDSVTYGDGFPEARQASIALDPGARNADADDDGANWCLGRDVYFASPPDGDHRGTPGAPNPPCGAPSCDPDPCLDPPLVDCADDHTVRRYPAAGTCSLGANGVTCDYAPMLEACADGRVCRRGACVLPDRQPPAPGDVVFTEIMPDPDNGLADADAEWFEVYNRTGGRITLDGCEIADGSGMPEPIVGGLMEPSGYLLFARSADRAVNGGLRPDLLFTFSLGAHDDRLRLSCGGQVIDEVDYNGFRTGPARALSLDPGAVDAAADDRAESWCLARAPYAHGADGDNLGTPRAPNPPCAVPVQACALAGSDPLAGAPFQLLSGLGTVQVAGVTDRTSHTDPAPDVRGQLGLSRDGEPTRWFDAAPDATWDATAAGQPGFDRYRAEFVVPVDGPWNLGFRFSADGGFSWTDCAGSGVLTVGDQGACMGAGCAPTQPGEVVINEIMYDPQFALDDATAEWIELYNASIRPVDLSGCVLADDPASPDALTIGAVNLAPGDYALFARSADPMLNGGIAPVETFDFGLDNSGDTVVLVCDDVEIDRVHYDDGPEFPDAGSRSLSLDPGALDHGELGSSWCLGATPYFHDPVGADRDDFGTPGAPNPPCP